MYLDFILIQDILMKEIIGHGTKKGGSTIWMTSKWDRHIMWDSRVIPE